MTISYRKLLNKIEAFCAAHMQIKKYAGEFREQMPNFSTKDEKYPIVFVVPTSGYSDLNAKAVTLDIYCVDLIQDDRENINTILSDCELILNDLFIYFKNGNDFEVDVVGTATMSPLNNYDLDYAAGWVANITFEIEQYGVCAIPIEPIPTPTPSDCLPASYTIENTNDEILAFGDINSGASQVIVVGDSIVTNTDSTYTESIPAENTLTLPDTNIDIYINSVYQQTISVVTLGNNTITIQP